MKIQLLAGAIMAGPQGTYTQGAVLDIDATVAKSLVDQGKAIQVEQPKAKPASKKAEEQKAEE